MGCCGGPDIGGWVMKMGKHGYRGWLEAAEELPGLMGEHTDPSQGRSWEGFRRDEEMVSAATAMNAYRGTQSAVKQRGPPPENWIRAEIASVRLGEK